MNDLNNMPGNIDHFKADDEGRTKHLKCPTEDVLLLKKNCKVMLIWNKTNCAMGLLESTKTLLRMVLLLNLKRLEGF